jgi:hypothetical protein
MSNIGQITSCVFTITYINNRKYKGKRVNMNVGQNLRQHDKELLGGN